MSISGGRGAVPSPRHLLPQDQLYPRHPSPWPGCPPHHRRGHLHQHRPHHPHHPNNHDHHPSHFHFDTWYHLFLSSYPHHDLYLIVFIFQWQQASCPILYFVIEYKLANQLDWTIGDLSKQSLQLSHQHSDHHNGSLRSDEQLASTRRLQHPWPPAGHLLRSQGKKTQKNRDLSY